MATLTDKIPAGAPPSAKYTVGVAKRPPGKYPPLEVEKKRPFWQQFNKGIDAKFAALVFPVSCRLRKPFTMAWPRVLKYTAKYVDL